MNTLIILLIATTCALLGFFLWKKFRLVQEEVNTITRSQNEIQRKITHGFIEPTSTTNLLKNMTDDLSDYTDQTPDDVPTSPVQKSPPEDPYIFAFNRPRMGGFTELHPQVEILDELKDDDNKDSEESVSTIHEEDVAVLPTDPIVPPNPINPTNPINPINPANPINPITVDNDDNNDYDGRVETGNDTFDIDIEWDDPSDDNEPFDPNSEVNITNDVPTNNDLTTTNALTTNKDIPQTRPSTTTVPVSQIGTNARPVPIPSQEALNFTPPSNTGSKLKIKLRST